MIFIRKISKGHNSVKNVGGGQFLFFAHSLMMVYICTKFHENIMIGIRVMERTLKVNRRTDVRTDRGRARHNTTRL